VIRRVCCVCWPGVRMGGASRGQSPALTPGQSAPPRQRTREVASYLLAEAVAAGFQHVPPDLLWMTSMLGYARRARFCESASRKSMTATAISVTVHVHSLFTIR